MTTVRYTADGGHYRVGGHGFDPGDEKDVDDDLADYLTDRDDFEVVDTSVGQEDEPPDTCDELIDGEVCGRDLPCRYHSDDEED